VRHGPGDRKHVEATVLVQHGQHTQQYALPADATAGDLALMIENDKGLAPSSMRLIANGREMSLTDPIATLGEFFFTNGQNVIFLREVDHRACREWQRTGRCTMGSRCLQRASHDMHNSPRYVAHSSCAHSLCSSSSSSSTESSPQHTPPSSPLVCPQQAPKVCRNWAKNGSCRFGKKCRYASSHKSSFVQCKAQRASPKAPEKESSHPVSWASVVEEAHALVEALAAAPPSPPSSPPSPVGLPLYQSLESMAPPREPPTVQIAPPVFSKTSQTKSSRLSQNWAMPVV